MSDDFFRILGIDYGSVRVGLSLSDPMRIIAKALKTILNDSRLIGEIQKIVEEQNVKMIIVGYPLDLKGQNGIKTEEVDRFIEQLQSTITVPIEKYDERFTSVIAEKAILRMGLTKKQRRDKSAIDEIASAILLQDYLDSHKKSS